VAMDRGYNDYKLFASWTENGIYFVTRMKDNADFTFVEWKTIPITGDVLSDQLI
jgi:IS4 transposase